MCSNFKLSFSCHEGGSKKPKIKGASHRWPMKILKVRSNWNVPGPRKLPIRSVQKWHLLGMQLDYAIGLFILCILTITSFSKLTPKDGIGMVWRRKQVTCLNTLIPYQTAVCAYVCNGSMLIEFTVTGSSSQHPPLRSLTTATLMRGNIFPLLPLGNPLIFCEWMAPWHHCGMNGDTIAYHK